MELADELDSLGHRNRVVAISQGHEGGVEVELPPLVARVGQAPPVLLLAALRLRRQLREAPVDVILAHGGAAVQVAALAVPRGGPLLVWQRILGFPESVRRPLRRRWLGLLARRVDGVAALTEELGDEVRALGYHGPVWVIPNFRRADRFRSLDHAAARGALRTAVLVGPDVPLVGFVGHLVDQKRPERAVEVVAALAAAGSPAHLVVAGAGPLAPAVTAEAERRGVTDRVHLLGHRDDVEQVLAGIDLLVLTSDAEGIPGLAIEAQMAGCPVVTFPLGGVGDVVAHGVTGVVLDRIDVDAMTSAVADLLADPDQRSAMGEEARRRSERFAIDVIAPAYIRHIRGLGAHHAVPSSGAAEPRSGEAGGGAI